MIIAQKIQENLAKADVVLPTFIPAIANYVPWKIAGKILEISGQLPLKEGVAQGPIGTVADEVSMDECYQTARLCAINILAHVYAAIEGDWSKIKGCTKVRGFVASSAHFQKHPAVVNGASDLLVEILGDAGRHTRAAVGVSSLPMGVVVEVEATFELV